MYFGPYHAIASNIYVIGIRLKPLYKHLVNIYGICAGEFHKKAFTAVLNKCTFTVFGIICRGSKLYNCSVFCRERVGKPYKPLFGIAVHGCNRAKISRYG